MERRARTRRAASPSAPAILISYVPEDSRPSGLHQPELPHADDRGLPSPSGDADGGERVGQVDLAAFDVLRDTRGIRGGLRLPAGTGRRQGWAGLPVRRRAAQPASSTPPVSRPAADAGVSADGEPRPGHALAVS